ncbi:hypothetical protein MBLNU457_4901t1 [Dothideomycetes sp. NU457]
MSAPSRTSSSESTDTLRKRVCKACDRCRMKKSKCDGSNPCTRCRADNAICVFGERKKSHDKVYPKGYVEMLEQQQGQLVAGLQETYRRLMDANLWPGAPLSETEGHPLTHDILARLNIVSNKTDADDMFEEDCEALQQRLVNQGAPYMTRRGSNDSESDHSQTHGHKRSRSGLDTPIASPRKPSFRKSFDSYDRTRTSSPVSHSPVMPRAHSRSVIKPSPLHNESPVQETMPSIDDDVLYSSWDWQNFGSTSNQQFDSQFSFQQPGFSTVPSSFDSWQGFESHPVQFDTSLLNNSNQTHAYMNTNANTNNQVTFQDWQQQPIDGQQPMDVDFSKFVQVAT